MDPSRARQGPRLGWLSDFEWADGRLRVRKTDVRLRLDRGVIAEILNWLGWLPMLGVVALAARLGRRSTAPAVWFTPDVPRPWYVIRAACLAVGVRTAASEDQATAAVFFDDATHCDAPPPTSLPSINWRCTDVSKGRVARVFEEVFGYRLAIDPTRAAGPIVEKSEKNGVHDGRVVQAPVIPREGFVYQRLIDTTAGDGLCHDLRTPCVGGVPVVVIEKLKPGGESFSINNLKANLREPSEVYSDAELALIGRFCERMGLDWCGLDILRDRVDGRLYIVDANKTDLGPVIALSGTAKVRLLKRLGRALERLVAAKAADRREACRAA